MSSEFCSMRYLKWGIKGDKFLLLQLRYLGLIFLAFDW